MFPYADGNALVGVVGYALNSIMAAYPSMPTRFARCSPRAARTW